MTIVVRQPGMKMRSVEDDVRLICGRSEQQRNLTAWEKLWWKERTRRLLKCPPIHFVSMQMSISIDIPNCNLKMFLGQDYFSDYMNRKVAVVLERSSECKVNVSVKECGSAVFVRYLCTLVYLIDHQVLVKLREALFDSADWPSSFGKRSTDELVVRDISRKADLKAFSRL